MFSDLILDGEMDDILAAAQDCCAAGQSYLRAMGHLSEGMLGALTSVRDDLSMLLACYEDGPRRRFACPSVREELRRLEGITSTLIAQDIGRKIVAQHHAR